MAVVVRGAARRPAAVQGHEFHTRALERLVVELDVSGDGPHPLAAPGQQNREESHSQRGSGACRQPLRLPHEGAFSRCERLIPASTFGEKEETRMRSRLNTRLPENHRPAYSQLPITLPS